MHDVVVANRCSRALLVLLLVAAGCADHARATLRYAERPDGPRCLGRGALARDVSGLLGYDPWRGSAAIRISASVTRRGDRWLGRIELRDARNQLQGSRQLEAPWREAHELAKAMALAIGLAIDPIAVQARQPAAARADHRSLHRRARAPAWSVTAAVGLGLGAVPSPAAAGSVAVEARWRYLSVAVEGRFLGLGSAAGPSATQVSVWRMGGAVLACGHLASLRLCPIADISGAWASSSGLRGAHREAAAIPAGGVRLGWRLGSHRRLALDLKADLYVPLARVVYTDDLRSFELWRAPPVFAMFSAGLATSFF